MSNKQSKRPNYRHAAESVVAHLQELGSDVSIRYAYDMMGLSNKDQSVDISVLYSPKEFLIYITGYVRGKTDERQQIAAELGNPAVTSTPTSGSLPH